jgi:hypothetical protein
MRASLRVAAISAGLIWLGSVAPVFSQTEDECLQTFNVQPGKSVTYIASDATGMRKAPVTTSCGSAELFREKLYIAIDKNTYDSITVLRSRLSTAKQQVQQIKVQVNAATDAARVGAIIKGAVVVVTTPLAVTTTAACASGLINGAGLAACGVAAGASVEAVSAWYDFKAVANDLAATKQKANGQIQKIQDLITSTETQLNATLAGDMKNNYSQLFIGICRAVKQQCL